MIDYQITIESETKIDAAITELLAYLETNSFQGWEPYDIPKWNWLNSPANHALRVMITQLYRLSPISLHPYFEQKKIHAKAATLLARAFLTLYEMTAERQHYEQALFFLNWIKEHRSETSKNFSIGNQYQLAMKSYDAQPGTPAPLLTCLAIEAFISAYEILNDRNFLELAASGIRYFLEELPLIKMTDDQWYFIYHPNNRQFIPNMPAVISGTLSHYYAITNEPELLPVIKNNLNCIVKSQRSDGAWLYHPGSRYSDNFHTAFILNALAGVRHHLGDRRFESAFEKGLAYYTRTFFSFRGRPIHKKIFGLPTNADSFLTRIDLRDCAMGLVFFSFLITHHQYPLALPLNLLNWTMDHFRSEQGFFHYQKIPFYTIKGPFLSMQAWMLYALSQLKKSVTIHR